MGNTCLQPNIKQNKISQIQLLACGSCENDLGIVFRGRKKEKRTFPAMVGVIHHRKYGVILYDTGYSERIKKCGIKSFLYQLVNKATVCREEIISNQLLKQGIKDEDVKYIILSHAHPDHIGALRHFHHYSLLSTKDVFCSMKNGKLRDLVFGGMLPVHPVKKYVVREKKHRDSFLYHYFDHVYDICRDGSILGVPLDGHAKGQLGLYFPEYNLLLAADACWGKDLMECVPRMNPIPRLIQNDFKAYENTVRTLQHLQADHPEVEIVFSHQTGGFPQYADV